MKIGCIVMASGLSNRFGANKLLAEINGNSLIKIILDKTEELSDKAKISRLVLTRTKEVYELCNERGIKVILHELENRNEAVRLGINQMRECDACVFCTCDQPLLKKESIIKLIDEFMVSGKGIYRLSYNDKVGNPILFSKEYFEELTNLPYKKGGSYLAAKYPDEVRLINASDEWELFDVDTPSDLALLNSVPLS